MSHKEAVLLAPVTTEVVRWEQDHHTSRFLYVIVQIIRGYLIWILYVKGTSRYLNICVNDEERK